MSDEDKPLPLGIIEYPYTPLWLHAEFFHMKSVLQMEKALGESLALPRRFARITISDGREQRAVRDYYLGKLEQLDRPLDKQKPPR